MANVSKVQIGGIEYDLKDAVGRHLGITGATVGQLAQIAAVDENGIPTAWEAVDKPSGGGDEPVESFPVTWNLVNVTSSSNVTSVSSGAALVAVLTADMGYTLGEVTVTMGGSAISGVWNADTSTVTIPAVTGAVVISCAGVAAEQGETEDVLLDVTFGCGVPNWKNAGFSVDGEGVYVGNATLIDALDANLKVLCPTDSYGHITVSRLKVAIGLFDDSGTYQGFWDLTNQKVITTDSWQYFTIGQTCILPKGYQYRLLSTANDLSSGSNPDYAAYWTDQVQIWKTLEAAESTSGLSVAAMVDNQVAMLALSTGQTVDTSAYSGLSSDYVSMVQANYDAMMAECLGDYDKIPLIVHADHHGRIGSANPVMKLIGDLVNWYEVSKCINLGDTVTDRFGETELENYLSATKDTIPLSKRLEVYGNHDIWDSDEDQKYTVDQKRLSPYFKNIYARRRGNNGYFTVVDDYYNVKYIVINNMEYPDTNYQTKRITTAQADFLVSELSAEDGRDIVLVSHAPFDSDGVASRDSTYLAYSEKFLSDSSANTSFMEMLEHRKTRMQGEFTDSEGVVHAYDFTNASGELLVSLHGHAHFEAYRTFDNSVTEFIFDWFAGNTFYFAYIDRKNKILKVWKNEDGVEALEISIA